MNLRFPYRKIRQKSFPVIPVTLRNGKHEIGIEVLVDAGANISVFNAKVAKLLGIELNKGKRIYPLGISGHICAYIHDITILVEDVEIKTKAAFSEDLLRV